MSEQHRDHREPAETRGGKTPREAHSPADPAGELREGALVGDQLRLRRELATGGMAHVWVAEHLGLGVEVAVKFLRAPEDRVMRGRLAREAELAARIDHPHAVRMLDHGQTERGTPYVVMELLEGESLAERLKRAGALELNDATTLVRQVADVLTAAHALGIVWRSSSRSASAARRSS